jgi:hypothetical protein
LPAIRIYLEALVSRRQINKKDRRRRELAAETTGIAGSAQTPETAAESGCHGLIESCLHSTAGLFARKKRNRDRIRTEVTVLAAGEKIWPGRAGG